MVYQLKKERLLDIARYRWSQDSKPYIRYAMKQMMNLSVGVITKVKVLWKTGFLLRCVNS